MTSGKRVNSLSRHTRQAQHHPWSTVPLRSCSRGAWKLTDSSRCVDPDDQLATTARSRPSGNAVAQPQCGLAGEVVTKGFLEERDASAGQVTRRQSGRRGGVTRGPQGEGQPAEARWPWVMLEPEEGPRGPWVNGVQMGEQQETTLIPRRNSCHEETVA